MQPDDESYKMHSAFAIPIRFVYRYFHSNETKCPDEFRVNVTRRSSPARIILHYATILCLIEIRSDALDASSFYEV